MNKQCCRLFTGLFCLVVLGACEWLDQLQNMETPVIAACSPAEELIEAESLSCVDLTFSREMNRKMSEDAFSLEEDDTALDGFFSWSGNTMCYTPYYGFKANRDYKVVLKKSAEDKWGNSLERDWYHVFTSANDQCSPAFLSSVPADYTVLSSSREPLVLRFSEEMDPLSFRTSLSLSPDIPMDLVWDDREEVVTLTPLEDYEEDQDYTLTLSTDITDRGGNPLLREIKLFFPALPCEKLALDSLTVKVGSTGLVDESHGINTELEKDLVLEGSLNGSADYEERNALVSLLPSRGYDLLWKGDYKDFELSFTEYLSYGSYYDLTILDKTYILCIDGEGSRPIQLSRIVFCPDSTAPSPVFTALSLNSPLGASDSSSAFLDFYLDLAPGASVNLYDFMDALTIESSVLGWDYLSLEVYDGTQTPSPNPLPGAGETLIRLNTAVSAYGLPGRVTFSLENSLSDTRNNTLNEKWSLTVMQP